MALPSVQIAFTNGALGRTAATTDGVVGLICQITAEGTMTPGTAYLFRGVNNLTALGITKTTNPVLTAIVEDFYKQAGNGAALWVVASTTQTIGAAVTAYVQKIVRESQFDVKTVFVYNNTFASATITNGFNAELATAITNAQTEATSLLTNYYAPVAVVIDGNTAYDGSATPVTNYRTAPGFNRVAVFLGKKESASKTGTMLGYLMAKVATVPVQRNVARVKDGSIFNGNLYIGTELAQNHDIISLHDKGFITLRTFIGKSGYFFTDDNMLAPTTDDYAQLAYRRVVDKAYRIAYTTVVDELLDELPVNSNGTIQAHKARVIEGLITTAIANNMTAFGELNTLPDDPKDKGVVVTVDETNNVLSTGQVKVNIGVRPYGYARLITLQLGFKTTN